MSVYVNVWRPVHITHACAGDGKTLCGVRLEAYWEEGAAFDGDEAETYVSCKRCLAAIAKDEASAPTLEQPADREPQGGNG